MIDITLLLLFLKLFTCFVTSVASVFFSSSHAFSFYYLMISCSSMLAFFSLSASVSTVEFCFVGKIRLPKNLIFILLYFKKFGIIILHIQKLIKKQIILKKKMFKNILLFICRKYQLINFFLFKGWLRRDIEIEECWCWSQNRNCWFQEKEHSCQIGFSS